VQELIDSLDTETWTQVTEGLAPRSLGRLQMPKFTLRYEKTLNDVLKDLGMGVAFTGRANFRGIADLSLAIDKAKHKTFLRVGEEETEASAATSVEMSLFPPLRPHSSWTGLSSLPSASTTPARFSSSALLWIRPRSERQTPVVPAISRASLRGAGQRPPAPRPERERAPLLPRP
jgi:Serine protease inhibitor